MTISATFIGTVLSLEDTANSRTRTALLRFLDRQSKPQDVAATYFKGGKVAQLAMGDCYTFMGTVALEQAAPMQVSGVSGNA